MRRQIVIMLLGLMTTLSLPAFAIAGSRESDHATQPYKYIGKELDRTHGLDWYDHGARHYAPVTGRWNTMDLMCEKYYGISPYASCGDDPVNEVDPDGKDIYIIYSDKNGNERSFRFSGFQGRKSITIPNNQFVKDFMQAYLYNGKNGGRKNTIRAATNPKYKIYVINIGGNSFYTNEQNTSIINWNSRNGMLTSSAGRQSPATIIEHEMSHAIDDQNNHKNHVDRRNTMDEKYENKEERRVIIGSETQTAISNNEGTRNDHYGNSYETESPITTHKKKKLSNNEN
mgnify:CR=1 FL=1